MAVSCMRHASGHNYTNSSFIVDVAMGQIVRYHVSQNVFLVFITFSMRLGILNVAGNMSNLQYLYQRREELTRRFFSERERVRYILSPVRLSVVCL